MGCAQTAPNDNASGRIKELEKENEKLKQQLKESQKKLSKYELNTPQPQLNILVSESFMEEPPTPLPSTPQTTDNIDQKVKENENIDEEAILDKPKPKPKPPKKIEKDPFWLDIEEKVNKMNYMEIKKCLPNSQFIDEEDENWKMQLWKKPYGDYELHCFCQLVSYNTGKWTEDDTNLLFASVSKYGLNSKAAWEKIAENCNRELDDVMNKYSKLVSIPVKKLKKMSVARG